MRIVINQPNYIPWRGYFDMIDDADLFLFHDDVQYTKQDWRNRNRIKTKHGTIWLTVPALKASVDTQVKDVLINYGEPWIVAHQRQLTESYRTAPYFANYVEGFFEILEKRHKRLLDLNIETTKFIMKALGIFKPTRMVSELNIAGKKTEKLINIMRTCGGNAYLSGPTAKAYIDESKFKQAGIGLEWKEYNYMPYPQLWGKFESHVSVLDLLFNCGHDAKKYLKSQSAEYPLKVS